jgi:hypothetical protein
MLDLSYYPDEVDVLRRMPKLDLGPPQE